MFFVMKKLFIIPILAISIIACNSGGGDKQVELDNLKKQEAEEKQEQAKVIPHEEDISKYIPLNIYYFFIGFYFETKGML